MIEAHCEVLVKGLNGLLDVMEGAAARLAPQLVVMGSAALTLAHLNTASVMGSVTLSVLKRLTIPVAVATSNSRHLVLTQRRELGWAEGLGWGSWVKGGMKGH